MLRRLGIRNYALIEGVDVEFGPGMTVITGETGSGKSIMLGALSLLTGGRADSRVVAGGKSRIEATFEDVDPEMRRLFEERGIEWVEYDDADGTGTRNEVAIRREIAAEGRSKIYINDTPVTLATLAAIGPKLVYIHSQHANAGLSDEAEQLHVVDVFSGALAQLEDYRRDFRRFAALRRDIDRVKERNAKNRENEEFLRFQCGQLDALKPKKGELTEIEKRYEVLSDADEIKQRLASLASLFGIGDRGMLGDVAEARGIVDKIDFSLFGRDAEDQDIPARMEVMETEIRDIADAIDDMYSGLDTNPAALERLSSRMQAYYAAVKHFKVKDADELADLHIKLKQELGELTGDGGELPELERQAREMARVLKEKAAVLTRMRQEGARLLGDEILAAARTLGLPNLKFEVRVSPAKLTSTGGDRVEFLCAFNRNATLQPVGDTASGGEMSRLMLSLKAVVARRMNMPTIVFDEVDTGVSGEIAEQMGLMMRRMGDGIQVMAITHLPQVAAQGVEHFKVYKRDEGDRTVTHVEKLDHEARVSEIAAMISGSEVTEAARENARALLKASM
jgi:DNA repair protein RecN (Recombination protein N)